MNDAERAIEDLKDINTILKTQHMCKVLDDELTKKDVEDYKSRFASVNLAISALEKLKVYRNLEEQRLLIKLPCKVGDIFYINIQKQTYECKISGFYISKDEIQFMVAFQDEDSKTWYETGETHKKEDLFLTREEAELKYFGDFAPMRE